MMKIKSLFNSVGVMCLASASSAEANSEQPNVVFILVDDMGWMDLGVYGSDYHQTPQIDRFASDGILLTDGYAACTVSSPTRASIMTGEYTARLQITDWIPGYQHNLNKQQLSKYRMISPKFVHNLPLEEKTIAEALKENGYKTCFASKWHCTHDSLFYPQYQGFDKNIGGYWSGNPRGNSKKGMLKNCYTFDLNDITFIKQLQGACIN